MRRFQYFKTLFCRSLLLNMQICYPRRKYEAKPVVSKLSFLGFKNASFWLVLPYIFTQDNKFACLIKVNFYIEIEYHFQSLDPSQIVVKPFKSLKILKVTIKRILLLLIANPGTPMGSLKKCQPIRSSRLASYR